MNFCKFKHLRRTLMQQGIHTNCVIPQSAMNKSNELSACILHCSTKIWIGIHDFKDKEKSMIRMPNALYCTAFAKFRTSCHNLEIKQGRHTNPITPFESRLCRICREIEDEIHFIIRRQLFETERLDLPFRAGNRLQIFSTLNETQRLIFLMKSSDALKLHGWQKSSTTPWTQQTLI